VTSPRRILVRSLAHPPEPVKDSCTGASDVRIDLRVDEPPTVAEAWKVFAVRDIASPKLWMDAYLAAFAVAAGYQMVTTDGAFRQFPKLDLLVLG
jgi:predicted nucleic acid-binding protein